MPVISRLVTIKGLKKEPYLFGQKFDLILDNCSTENLWRNRDHVIALLGKLQKFAELRGFVGHAIIEETVFNGHPAISLQRPGDDSWQTRLVITNRECDDLIDQLEKLTAKLLRQHLIDAAAPALPPTVKKPVVSAVKAPPNPPVQPSPAEHRPPVADI